MEYPYLASKKINEKEVVIFFIEENKGVIVHTEVDSNLYKFGKLGNFVETDYSFFDDGRCVRLSN